MREDIVNTLNLDQGNLRTFSCVHCEYTCYTYQQLTVHMSASHNDKHVLRKHIQQYETRCMVCLKEFHTRERLLDHYRYRSERCRIVLMQRGPVLTSDQVELIEAGEREGHRQLFKQGKRRHFAKIPFFKSYGPTTPTQLILDRISFPLRDIEVPQQSSSSS